MKKDLFQLNKSYPGNLWFKEQELSCVLWFEELKMFLTITSIDLELDIDLESNEELFGYTATEEGIMYFRSHNFFGTYISSNKKTYLLNDFVVSKSIRNYQDLIIGSISFGFDNLISLDNYLSLKVEKRKLEFDFNFDKIILLEDGEKEVSVVNQVNRRFQYNSQYLFTLAVTPFISYKLSERIKIKSLHSYSEGISWFLQLVFGNRQKAIYITFSGRGAHKEEDEQLEFKYFHSEILRAGNDHLLKKHVNRPMHSLTDLLQFLKLCYGKWDRLFEERPILIRLFFNEINSKRIISDDRFKNLCSIIQGLDKFCIVRKETDFSNKKIRGQMLGFLHGAFDSNFIAMLNESSCKADLIGKLLVIIHDQRDFYQHLNKPLSFNLATDSDALTCVNKLLEINIRYHLLTAIQFPVDKTKDVIQRELNEISPDLKSLLNKL